MPRCVFLPDFSGSMTKAENRSRTDFRQPVPQAKTYAKPSAKAPEIDPGDEAPFLYGEGTRPMKLLDSGEQICYA
jgi:hypothetical protein